MMITDGHEDVKQLKEFIDNIKKATGTHYTESILANENGYHLTRL